MSYLDTIVAHAQQQLDEHALDALNSRGVTDEQAAAFQLGYLDGTLPDLPPEAKPFLEWCYQGARLKDMLVYPLTNVLGEIQGVQFRPRQREVKGYIDYFLTQAEPVCFGLGQAMPAVWDTRSVWLVEGVHDLFPIQRHYPPIVAILSSKFTPVLVRFLRRMVDTVYLGFDSDATGRMAAAKVQRIYGREVNIRLVQYPSIIVNGKERVKDPGDLWEARGDSFVQQFVQQTVQGVF